MTPILISLCQQMADHTAPECANCVVPHSCCDPVYCQLAEDEAMRQGIELPHTDHPRLPFMSPTGCVVPPHLRLLCTVHTCAVNSFGFKPHDAPWTKRYFELREGIERELGDLL